MQNPIAFLTPETLPVILAVITVAIFKLATTRFTVRVLVAQLLLMVPTTIAVSFLILTVGRIYLDNAYLLSMAISLFDFWISYFLSFLVGGILAAQS